MLYVPQFKTAQLTFTGGLDAVTTTGIVVNDVSGVDITKAGLICLSWSDPLSTDTAEWITYTSINGSNELQGVVRGQEGSSAKTHADQSVLAWPLSKKHINDLNDAVLALNLDNDGYMATTDTWVYTSSTSFTIIGADRTSIFTAGLKIKCTNSTVKYFYVKSSIYSGGNTVVTLVATTEYSLANAAITANYYSRLDMPVGFPSILTFAPTHTGFSVNPTVVMPFTVIGRRCFFDYYTISTGTSNANNFFISLPFTVATFTGGNIRLVHYAKDNSLQATAAYLGNIASADTKIELYNGWSGAGWTITGAKASDVSGSFPI